MFPLTHIGITFFLGTLLSLTVFVAIIGSVLPDLIDKGLFITLHTPNPRFIAHTVFFPPLVSLLTYALTRKKSFAIAMLFATYLHLVVDLNNFLPLFYPFVNYKFPDINYSVETFVNKFNFEFYSEIFGVALIMITIKFNSKLVHFRDSHHIKILNIFKNKR
jgi:hypothetical protein